MHVLLLVGAFTLLHCCLFGLPPQLKISNVACLTVIIITIVIIKQQQHQHGSCCLFVVLKVPIASNNDSSISICCSFLESFTIHRIVTHLYSYSYPHSNVMQYAIVYDFRIILFFSFFFLQILSACHGGA